MPLKRTPPTSPLKLTTSLGSLASFSDNEDRGKLAKARNKRKRDELDIGTCMSDMKKMFECWQEKQDEKFAALQKIVEDFKENCTQFKLSMEFITSQYEDLKEKYDSLQKENVAHITHIQILETEIEKLQHSSRASCVEFRKVPVIQDKQESKEYLLDLVIKAGKTLGMDLRPADLRDVYRSYAKPGFCKPIIAEFTSIITKESFINAAKSFNRMQPGNRFSTSHLQMNFPKTAVYISEVLTPRTKKLHFLAREHAKTYFFSYCWVAHGKIYLRKKDGSAAVRINSEKDLERLIKTY